MLSFWQHSTISFNILKYFLALNPLKKPNLIYFFYFLSEPSDSTPVLSRLYKLSLYHYFMYSLLSNLYTSRPPDKLYYFITLKKTSLTPLVTTLSIVNDYNPVFLSLQTVPIPYPNIPYPWPSGLGLLPKMFLTCSSH